MLWLVGSEGVCGRFGAECVCCGFVRTAVVVPDDVDDAADADDPDPALEEADRLDVRCVPLPACAWIDACRRCTGAAAGAGSVATVWAEATVFAPPVDVVFGLDVPHAATATVSASPMVKLTTRERTFAHGWSAGAGI